MLYLLYYYFPNKYSLYDYGIDIYDLVRLDFESDCSLQDFGKYFFRFEPILYFKEEGGGGYLKQVLNSSED